MTTSFNANTLQIAEAFMSLSTVVVALLDTEGQLIEANRGFFLLFPEIVQGDNLSFLFINPNFPKLLTIYGEDEKGLIFKGIFTIGYIEKASLSLQANIYRSTNQILVVAEHCIEDYSRLNAIVIELNEEMAEMQRQLIKTNRALKRHEADLIKLALTDPLTQIANRRHFFERAEEEITRCVRYQNQLSLISLDIDYFKRINDECGHDVGDIVIQSLAQAMQASIRNVDLPARLGGEEFMLLLPEISATEAGNVAKRIQENFALMKCKQVSWQVTASFGITAYRDEDTLTTLIKRSDQALYHSKNSGRNTITVLI